jgi:hypothetical protein
MRAGRSQSTPLIRCNCITNASRTGRRSGAISPHCCRERYHCGEQALRMVNEELTRCRHARANQSHSPGLCGRSSCVHQSS